MQNRAPHALAKTGSTPPGFGSSRPGVGQAWFPTLGWIWALVLLLAPTACAQSPVVAPAEPVTITIAGSTAMLPVLQALTTEFSHQHPQIIFSLRGGGSLLGESWAATGQVDLAASTLRPPLKTPAAETQTTDPPSTSPPTNPPTSQSAPGEDNRPDLVHIPIGIDGVAVVVHPRNPVTVLTLLQLRDIYSGHILSWTDVGWPGDQGGEDLLLVSREDGSGTRLLFEDLIMAEERVALTAVVMPTSQDVIDYVADHPQAIAYVSAAYLRDPQGGLRLLSEEMASPSVGSAETANSSPQTDSGPVAPVHIVPVEGLLPSVDNLAQQVYPLSRPIFLASAAPTTGWVRQFVDFALGPQGQQIIARFHAPVR